MNHRPSSPCPGCSFSDLAGNHPGPELARGELCDCGFASCREPHCHAEPVRALGTVLGAVHEDVYWCKDHCPAACADCGEVAVPSEGLRCAECWEAQEPAIIRGARVLAPVLADCMRSRLNRYEPPVPRHAFDRDTVVGDAVDAAFTGALAALARVL